MVSNVKLFFGRWLGLELGAEISRAEYKLRGHYGPLELVQSDRLWVGGLNLGVVGECPLTRDGRFKLCWGAGYNFTATRARRAEIDLGGWYGLVGLEISLDEKRPKRHLK